MPLRSILLACFMFCLCLITSAQEKITVSGVEYIVHEVKKGQTLFAISRSYAVPIEAISNANPSVKGGLNTGQRLLIPTASMNKKAAKTAPKLVQGELTHTARKKETLYSISKLYNVTLGDLIERNPGVVGGLKTGMTLVIPVEKVRSIDAMHQAGAANDSGRFHTVLPGETLYSISKLYDAKVQELKELNKLDGNSITIGSQIRLPGLSEESSMKADEFFDGVDLKDKYSIAYLLPFSIAENDTVQIESDGKELHPLTEIAMQFYFGARMALDTLASIGLNAEVVFHEVGQDESTVKPLVESGELKRYDLIFGPFHRRTLERVSKATLNTPIVCPVPQSNRVLMGNPGIIKAKSGRVEQIDAITTYASAQHTPGNVVIFMPEVEEEKELHRLALKSLRSKMPDIEIHEIYDWRDPQKFKTHFQLEAMNSVIIPSENLSVVSGLLTKLNGIAEMHPMTVYGLEKWAEFDNIDLAYKEKLNVHLAMSSWVDRADARTSRFVHDFRKSHNNDPSEYAFMGYDVTLHFGKRLMELGARFHQFIGTEASMGDTGTLHLPVDMRSTGLDNGLRNVGITIVDHQDLQLRPSSSMN